jgi:hypothetical protein
LQEAPSSAPTWVSRRELTKRFGEAEIFLCVASDSLLEKKNNYSEKLGCTRLQVFESFYGSPSPFSFLR